MDELDEIRRKKLEQSKKLYMNGGSNMDENLPSTPLTITDADLDEMIKKYSTIVVDCWAPWCGPCRMVGPIVDEIADELSGKLKVVKVDIDASQDLAMKYSVMSIPTLIVLKGGEVVDQFVGALPKDQLLDKINPHL